MADFSARTARALLDGHIRYVSDVPPRRRRRYGPALTLALALAALALIAFAAPL